MVIGKAAVVCTHVVCGVHEIVCSDTSMEDSNYSMYVHVRFVAMTIHGRTRTHTHRPFRGLVDDLLRCYSLYRSDILDAFSLQGLAALVLIYFANITLAFTFGAFLSDITQGSLVSS